MTRTHPVAVGLLLAVAMALSACRPPPPKGEGGGNPAAKALAGIADDLARGLAGKRVSCIAVGELLGPRHGGRERSSLGGHLARLVAARLGQKAPRLRFVQLEDCPKGSQGWMDAIQLGKADAVLEGAYARNGPLFDLVVAVRYPLGADIATSTRQVAATDDYVRLAADQLAPVPRSSRQTEVLDAMQLKSELYHLAATDPDIHVTIHPVAGPVRMGGLIAFTVESSVNGYLSILYQGSSGGLAFLVPNRIVERVAISAGRPLRVPNPSMARRTVDPATGLAVTELLELRATPPAGWERVKAVVTRQPVPWPRDPAGNVPTDTLAKLRAVHGVLREARFGEARCELQTTQ